MVSMIAFHATFRIRSGAEYLNASVVHIGLGWYLWLMIASIRRFMCQPPGTAARRVLLPYAVFTLLVNAGLTIATAALQAHEFDAQFAPGPGPFCSPANTLYRLMLAMPVVMNDALLLYRAGTLYDWRRRVLIVPVFIYSALVVTAIAFNLACTGISALFTENLNLAGVVLLALTVLLNVVLTTLIIVKLVGARRAARVFGAVQTASSYSDIIAIVVESALAWVLAICLGVIFNTDGFQNTPVGLLFTSISENMSLLSPAMLLYWIAHNMHYTPSTDKLSSSVSSKKDEIDAAEKQIVKEDIIL